MDNPPPEKKASLPLSWARTIKRLRSFRLHKTEQRKEKESAIVYPRLNHTPSVPVFNVTPTTASARRPYTSSWDLTAPPERFASRLSLFSSRHPKAAAGNVAVPARSQCPTHVVDSVEIRKRNQDAGTFNPSNSCLSQHPNLQPCQTRQFFADELADLDEYRTYLTDHVFTFADAVNERTNLTDRLDSARKHLRENTKDPRGSINTFAFPRPPLADEERMKLTEHPHHIEYYFNVLKEFAVAHGWKGPGADSLQRAATNMEYEDLDWDDQSSIDDGLTAWDKFDFGYLPIII